RDRAWIGHLHSAVVFQRAVGVDRDRTSMNGMEGAGVGPARAVQLHGPTAGVGDDGPLIDQRRIHAGGVVVVADAAVLAVDRDPRTDGERPRVAAIRGGVDLVVVTAITAQDDRARATEGL